MAENGQSVSNWRNLAALWCMLETVCFGGLQFGWASLVYVLKQEGFFSDTCENFNETLGTNSGAVKCDDQDKQLSLLYSVANGISVIPIFLCGTLLSRFGPVKTRVAYAVLFIIGCAFMIASSSGMPWFACVGIMLLAGAGKAFLLTNLQVSRLYVTGSFLFIACLSGCYDSSSAITFFIKLAYESGVGIRVSFAVVLCLSLTTFLNTYFTFCRIIPSKDEFIEVTDTNTYNDVPKVTIGLLFKAYVFNSVYISHFVWFTLIAVHFAFFISSSNIYIQDIAQAFPDADESSLTNFLSITLLAGIVPGILVGAVIELSRLKLKGTSTLYIQNLKTTAIGFLITNFLSILIAVLSIFHVKPLVYLNFISVSVLRAILFAMVYSFLSKAFPMAAFGILSAMIDVQACFIILIQRAFIQWLTAYGDASTHIRICFIITSVVAMFHPVLIYMKSRRAAKEERCKREQEPSVKDVLQLETSYNTM